jgi:hypothetical protein
VEERVAAFIEDNLRQAAQFRTNNIMLSMGADFVYSNANTWFKNMDKLIHYVNKVRAQRGWGDDVKMSIILCILVNRCSD